MKRVAILLREEDKEAARIICERYGLMTRSDAIRFALRMLASSSKQLVLVDTQEKTNKNDSSD